MLSETKIEETFQNTQFEIKRYNIFCKGKNKHREGTMLYNDENIPCREQKCNILRKENDFSLSNRRCLWIGLYYPPNQSESVLLDNLSKELTNLAVPYDNFMLLGVFDLTMGNNNPNSFKNVFKKAQ